MRLLLLSFLLGLPFQQTTLPTQTDSPAAETPAAEIHIDEYCRVLTRDRYETTEHYSAPRYRRDRSICTVDSKNVSHHWEQNLVAGVVRRTYVTVLEHEFLLHDTTDQPLTFVIEQPVPKGWRIDSDPQPTRIERSIAYFTVQAQPGQTVRIHIGERKN